MQPSGATVHVVDDDEAVRTSLRLLLSSMELEARDYASAADVLNAPFGPCDCIVTDLRMPGIDGLQLIDRLRAAGVMLPVIVITGHGDVRLAVEAMRRGAEDFLEKPFGESDLVDAVARALDQRRFAMDRLGERERARRALAALTARERDVVEHLLAGESNKTIARSLGLSPRTVEEYRAKAMSKMDVTNLSRLVHTMLLANTVI